MRLTDLIWLLCHGRTCSVHRGAPGCAGGAEHERHAQLHRCHGLHRRRHERGLGAIHGIARGSHRKHSHAILCNPSSRSSRPWIRAHSSNAHAPSSSLHLQVSSGSETIDLNSVENFYHTYPGDVFYAKALVAVSQISRSCLSVARRPYQLTERQVEVRLCVTWRICLVSPSWCPRGTFVCSSVLLLPLDSPHTQFFKKFGWKRCGIFYGIDSAPLADSLSKLGRKIGIEVIPVLLRCCLPPFCLAGRQSAGFVGLSRTG